MNDSNNVNKLYLFMYSWIKDKIPNIPEHRVNDFLQRFLTEMGMVGNFDRRYSEELNSLITQAKVDLEINALLDQNKNIIKYL